MRRGIQINQGMSQSKPITPSATKKGRHPKRRDCVSAHHHPDRRAEREAGDDQCIGESAAIFGEVRTQNFAVGRESDGLSDPENDADHKQGDEPVEHAGYGRGG